jgi:hypothetical protein
MLNDAANVFPNASIRLIIIRPTNARLSMGSRTESLA